MTDVELRSWLSRYDACLLAVLNAQSVVSRAMAEQRARECIAQFNAYLVARPTERGFVDLPGLAER